MGDSDNVLLVIDVVMMCRDRSMKEMLLDSDLGRERVKFLEGIRHHVGVRHAWLLRSGAGIDRLINVYHVLPFPLLGDQ